MNFVADLIWLDLEKKKIARSAGFYFREYARM